MERTGASGPTGDPTRNWDAGWKYGPCPPRKVPHPAAARPGPAAHAAGPENKGFWRLPPKSGPCYTSAASQEGFASGSPCGPPRQVPQAEQVIRVHDPIAAGRRAALRAVAVQGLVVALLAAAFLAQGLRAALAVGVGGLALVLGNALSAVVALGGIVPAPVAFGRQIGRASCRERGWQYV